MTDEEYDAREAELKKMIQAQEHKVREARWALEEETIKLADLQRQLKWLPVLWADAPMR